MDCRQTPRWSSRHVTSLKLAGIRHTASPVRPRGRLRTPFACFFQKPKTLFWYRTHSSRDTVAQTVSWPHSTLFPSPSPASRCLFALTDRKQTLFDARCSKALHVLARLDPL